MLQVEQLARKDGTSKTAPATSRTGEIIVFQIETLQPWELSRFSRFTYRYHYIAPGSPDPRS